MRENDRSTHTELMAPMMDEIVLTESEALLALGSAFDIFLLVLLFGKDMKMAAK